MAVDTCHYCSSFFLSNSLAHSTTFTEKSFDWVERYQWYVDDIVEMMTSWRLSKSIFIVNSYQAKRFLLCHLQSTSRPRNKTNHDAQICLSDTTVLFSCCFFNLLSMFIQHVVDCSILKSSSSSSTLSLWSRPIYFSSPCLSLTLSGQTFESFDRWADFFWERLCSSSNHWLFIAIGTGALCCSHFEIWFMEFSSLAGGEAQYRLPG